jgi:thiamine biosynthesis protein ThiS
MASAETKMVEIVLNGQPKAVPEGLALDALLKWLEINPGRVAVERNRSIVRKNDWSATRIEPGDQLEVVWFVGGGSWPR